MHVSLLVVVMLFKKLFHIVPAGQYRFLDFLLCIYFVCYRCVSHSKGRIASRRGFSVTMNLEVPQNICLVSLFVEGLLHKLNF